MFATIVGSANYENGLTMGGIASQSQCKCY